MMAAAANQVVFEQQLNSVGYELSIISNLDESLLATAYLIMEKERLLGKVFYQKVPTVSEFLGWMKTSNSVNCGCFIRDVQLVDAAHSNQVSLSRKEGAERSQSGGAVVTRGAPSFSMAGLGWLWNVSGVPGARKAECGMCFFRNARLAGLTIEFAQQLLDFSFYTVGLDVVHGSSPTRNRLAIDFARRLGFRQTCPLPKFADWHGEPADVVISFLTREAWEEFNGRRTQ
jgi:RimJ/RimL family protein N-acetyltransferase